MTKPASLDLLEKGAANIAATEETVHVDVDPNTMTSEEIDALVAEHEVETPSTWETFTVEQKRAWLNEQFGEEDAPSADEPAAEETAPAAETVAPKGKKSGKKAKAEPAAEEPEAAKVDDKAAIAAQKAADDAEFAEAAAASTKKGKGKKAASTEVVVSDTKEGEIVAKDEFQDLVNEIENMKEKEALSAVTLITDQTAAGYIKLGGVLVRVHANEWYKPYSSFQEFVTEKIGMKFRLACYYMQCYTALANGGIPFSKVKGLGWTKLAVIAPVINSDNIDHWVGVAKSQNVLTLKETIKAHKAANLAGELSNEGGDTTSVKSLTFKPHSDQEATIDAALKKAMDAANTEHKTVALEYICMDYLGAATLVSKLKAMGIEKAAEALSEAFPEWDILAAPAEKPAKGKAA